jgi:hypothetical protein
MALRITREELVNAPVSAGVESAETQAAAMSSRSVTDSPKLAETMRANRRLVGKVCPICQAAIKLGEEVRNCAACGLSHHLSCWNENTGCGTYGCSAGPQASHQTPKEQPAVGSQDAFAGQVTPPMTPKREAKPYLIAGGIVGAIIVVSLVVYVINYVQLQQPMNRVLANDARNAGIHMSSHYKHWLDGSVLIYDLEDAPVGKTRADVFRVLLQYAAQVKSMDFNEVELAYRGEVKFLLSGGDFKQIGRDYDTENPVYTIRTFPEKLKRPNGTSAFPQWTGGVLGVLEKQMEDFTAFNDQWYGS